MSDPKKLLKSLAGTWEGACRTWFDPDKLGDESTIKAEIRPLLGGLFLRHKYESQMQGQPRAGEETIAFNPLKQKFESAWIDDFHMNSGIMFSEGEQTERGFLFVAAMRRDPAARRGAGRPSLK